MNKLCWVQIVNSIDNLIKNEMLVNLLQHSTSYSWAEVWLHVLKEHINVLSFLGKMKGVEKNNIGVLQFLQILYFTIGPLCISSVPESIIYSFHRKYSRVLFSTNLPHLSISSLPNTLNDLIQLEDLWVNNIWNLVLHQGIKITIGKKDLMFIMKKSVESLKI